MQAFDTYTQAERRANEENRKCDGYFYTVVRHPNGTGYAVLILDSCDFQCGYL